MPETKDTASEAFMQSLREFLSAPDAELLPEMLIEFMNSEFLVLLEGDAEDSEKHEMLRIVSVMDENNEVLFAAFTSDEQLEQFNSEAESTLRLSGREIYDLVCEHHSAIILNPGGNEQMLIDSDWLMQVCGPRNPHLVEVLADYKSNKTESNKELLIDALACSIPLVALDSAPDEATLDGEMMSDDIELSVKHAVSKDGKELLILFSDLDQLMSHSQDSPWIACHPSVWLRWAESCAGIVINPSGTWVELSAADLGDLQSRIPEENEEEEL